MSTKIYSPSTLMQTEIDQIGEANSRRELDWLINEIIRPQLPSIRENLHSCFSKIDESSDQEYKLPLSSHNSEILKGVITRQNFKITGLNITMKSKNLNGGKSFNLKLKTGQFLIVRQILDCHDAIYNSIAILNTLLENEKLDRSTFLRYIENIYNQLDVAKNSLTSPNVGYIFPQHRVNATLFEPTLPSSISLDFLVNSSDLSIDFKSVRKVTTKPWDVLIDPDNHKSFADHVRARISEDRMTSIPNILIAEYTKLLEWKKNESSEPEDKSQRIGSTIKNIFNSNSDPSYSTMLKTANKYLESAVTYVDNDGDPLVVTIQENCDVVTSDPVLLSISIKLESLEKTVAKILENFKSCI
ncbi:hypothetical protein CANARDRAFT_26834 [[Candida] arabinofermentans NRRL YB-2248]|uniref:RAVE subunit 2/Rogdi n=1 Tax=[Candida] arabinofermentans NRRL YB-2248 TaxID=983967 RepID=A0A1E4T6Q8_9ASCO|nr:hypothetical protein CANARDRAFT_26834 [[Candida] arabinofermentans NRRL YB-2248]